jgi:hypothetical protein
VSTIQLELGKLESLLITNIKFAKKWLKMLKKHENGCPCVYNKYVENGYNFKFNKCPFNIRRNNKHYSNYCYECVFSRLLNRRKFRYYHIIFTLKRVIKNAS